MKRRLRLALSIILSLVMLSTTACGYSEWFGKEAGESYLVGLIEDGQDGELDSDTASSNEIEEEQVNESESERFNSFVEDLFAEVMGDSDLVSLHAYLEHPENYGIEDYEKSFGRTDFDNLGDTSFYDEVLEKLDEFEKSELTKSQQITYEELYLMMKNEKNYADLYLLNTDIAPTTGVQVQIPILLAEYSFVEKKDIEEYLTLLCDLDEYFADILKYEKLRADAGYFLEDDLADEVIDTCNSFLETAKSEDGVLISSFNERLEEFEGLTEEEKTSYKSENVTAINENVVPAYEALAKGVEELKGSSKYSGGICNYPDGKRYFEYLMNKRLGIDMSVDDYYELGEDYVEDLLNQMSTLMYGNLSVYNGMSNFSFNMSDPEAILEDLQKQIVEDFPAIGDTSYEVKYVCEALEDYASPAMYFLPQIDNLDINSIYINEGSGEKEIYPTLAHEAYPGHLYQTQYFASKNPDWIRYILAPGGYVEGWASYVEVYSYNFASTGNEDLNKLMGLNYETTLIIYALGDIGINYYDWDLDELSDFVTDYFNVGSDAVKTMYDAFVANPGNYCQYAFGMVAIEELKSEAEDELGDKFDIYEFHKYILDMGPAQFDILFDNLDAWCKSIS
ncbi:DUF885 domain-containing protein [Lachnospira multipara]|uniref:Uncharacterized conserved protein, DUF885 familyt n=1 Tax=Lachnospira multipara TaxID=28051 RepID=A0A1H5U5I1_9FIRM|nr:DUF885 domain-containing protein [Lachnospira multipara]SEF70294.1 Uncharacterized conserved protein, DUF885 familyt [Lachnospira multipara]